MTFTPDVYEQIRAGAQRSAARIVPLVYDLVRPRSVVDVGAGEGWFARGFVRFGCHVVAIDETAENETSEGGVAFFRRSLPCDLGERREGDRFAPGYDLAVCLEVAEHLPEEQAAPLIESLTACAPVVLWSAAIPGQSGHGHIACNWPAFYADLFAERGYLASEDLRWAIWDDETVEPWYRQNLLLYARRDWIADHRSRADVPSEALSFTRHPRAVVHPGIWAWKLG